MGGIVDRFRLRRWIEGGSRGVRNGAGVGGGRLPGHDRAGGIGAIRAWLPCALLLFVLTAVTTSPVAAQSAEDGPRVRVTLRRPADLQAGEAWQRQLIGTMLQATRDSLTLSLDPPVGTLSLAPSDVRRVEVSRGVPGRFASALQRGLGGALGGAMLGSLYNLIFEDDDSVSVGDSAAAWAGVFGGWGLVTGAIAPEERWRRTRWDDLEGGDATR